jgi:hypothetical protein
MYVYSNFNNRSGGGTGCLIFGILGMVAAYYILKGLFHLLFWASPVFFILALLINWRAVADTGKSYLKLLETRPVAGLLLGGLSVIGFPVLALYLFLKSIGYNQVQGMAQNFKAPTSSIKEPEDDFIDFEELETRQKDKEEGRR